jgi:hypothetical protein
MTWTEAFLRASSTYAAILQDGQSQQRSNSTRETLREGKQDISPGK